MLAIYILKKEFFMLVVIGIILPHVVLGLVIVIILVLMSMLTMAVVV